MSKKFLILGGIVLLLVIGAGGFVYYQQQQTKTAAAATKQTAQLEQGALAATVSAAGNLTAPEQVNLSFGVSGMPVTQVHVKVNDQVKAGDVLAQVQDTELQQAFATAQANLASAQAAYDEIQEPATSAELTAAEAKARAAQASYDAAMAALQELQEPVDALDLQAASAKLASAQEAYKSAQATSQMSDQRITVARATLETARIALQAAQAAYDRVAWQDNVNSSSEASALQTATIAYASAQAQYDLTLAEMNNSALKTAQATLASAQSEYNTVKAGATAQELASAQAAVDSALQTLTTANDDLVTLKSGATAQARAAAEATLQAAKANYESAKSALDDAKIIAPFDGTIAAVNIFVGQTPSSGATAITLANLDDLQIQLTLSEVDIANVKQGQKVELSFDALSDRVFSGEVISVAPVGTTNSGVVNYTVTVGLDKTDAAILPGMTASASIITQQVNDALLAPNKALKTQGTNRTMTLLFEGKEIPLIVKTGLAGEAYTEILSATTTTGTAVNLQAGDTVLLNSTTTSTSSSSQMSGGMPGGFMPPPN
jgi:HlyD family secretion protein